MSTVQSEETMERRRLRERLVAELKRSRFSAQSFEKDADRILALLSPEQQRQDGALLYVQRCGWCGAIEGTVPYSERCADASNECQQESPHQFGVVEPYIGTPPPENGEKLRLARIAEIIETVDTRALAADGPVTPTLQEMHEREMAEIYALATDTEGET